MHYLYIATAASVLVSLFISREKTFKALRIAYKRFVKILPAFLAMLTLVSIFGIKFSIVRLTVSLPLVIVSSMRLGRFLEKRQYRLTEGK